MGNFICCRRWEIIFLGLLQAPALRLLNLSNWILFTLESREFSYIHDEFFWICGEYFAISNNPYKD
jgi:hypothetical protein